MAYDHAGRLLQTDHKTSGSAFTSPGFVTLAKNQYNELGQLVKKGLHSADAGSSFKQQVDYRYNIRGWLTRINDAELSTADGGPKDYFGMNLGYHDGIGVPGAVSQYNGNISAIKYSANLGLGINDPELELPEPTERGYAFRYDALNRLEHADHVTRTTLWTSSDSYHERELSYDMNGNILSLSRSGRLDPNMDVLSYQYQGNRLLHVDDAGDEEEGFKDGNITGTDYLYDKNGNMTSDLNKGISLITYNHLNLPARVEKNSGEYLTYQYDATGRKLSQKVYSNEGALQKESVYGGEFFYENDTLQFVNTEEGRVVINEEDPEYQYMLKDHLGNVRMTFTSKENEQTFTATMETETQVRESEDFQNYGSTVNDLLDHTDAGTTYDRVLVLNGGYNGQVGLGKSFAVMPGDVINAKVYAKYMGSPGQASQLGNFAAALTGAFGLTPTAGIDGPTAYSALNDIGGILATGDHPGDEDEDPKGFLNVLVFDKNYNLVDFAFDQLGADFEQAEAVKAAHDELTSEVTVRQAGYVYVYLSNEEPNELQIGFDDFEVRHRMSAVVQMEEYYPFGLTFNSYQRENSVENKFKFQGQEHVDELNLGWDSFKWRNHQPDIGRFFSIDPLAESFYYNSPYAFSENKVTAHVELEGLEAWDIKNEWNDEFAAKYSGYVSQRAREIQDSGVECTCEDFAINVLVDFASENNLPVTFDNGTGIYDASDKNYSDTETFRNDVFKTTGAADLANTTKETSKTAVVPGDIFLQKNDKGRINHTQVVTGTTDDVITIKQGNFKDVSEGLAWNRSSDPKSSFTLVQRFKTAPIFELMAITFVMEREQKGY